MSGVIAVETSEFYKVKVTAGQKLAFEVLARRIGSPLDPIVVLHDAKTKRELVDLYADDTPGMQGDCRLAHIQRSRRSAGRSARHHPPRRRRLLLPVAHRRFPRRDNRLSACSRTRQDRERRLQRPGHDSRCERDRPEGREHRRVLRGAFSGQGRRLAGAGAAHRLPAVRGGGTERHAGAGEQALRAGRRDREVRQGEGRGSLRHYREERAEAHRLGVHVRGEFAGRGAGARTRREGRAGGNQHPDRAGEPVRVHARRGRRVRPRVRTPELPPRAERGVPVDRGAGRTGLQRARVRPHRAPAGAPPR